jgi:hypothetical protein
MLGHEWTLLALESFSMLPPNMDLQILLVSRNKTALGASELFASMDKRVTLQILQTFVS